MSISARNIYTVLATAACAALLAACSGTQSLAPSSSSKGSAAGDTFGGISQDTANYRAAMGYTTAAPGQCTPVSSKVLGNVTALVVLTGGTYNGAGLAQQNEPDPGNPTKNTKMMPVLTNPGCDVAIYVPAGASNSSVQNIAITGAGRGVYAEGVASGSNQPTPQQQETVQVQNVDFLNNSEAVDCFVFVTCNVQQNYSTGANRAFHFVVAQGQITQNTIVQYSAEAVKVHGNSDVTVQNNTASNPAGNSSVGFLYILSTIQDQGNVTSGNGLYDYQNYCSMFQGNNAPFAQDNQGGGAPAATTNTDDTPGDCLKRELAGG